MHSSQHSAPLRLGSRVRLGPPLNCTPAYDKEETGASPLGALCHKQKIGCKRQGLGLLAGIRVTALCLA